MLHFCLMRPVVGLRIIDSILLFLFVLKFDLGQESPLFNHYGVYQ